jgi:hypothetical protein
VIAQSVSLAEDQVPSPPIAKKDLKKGREIKGDNDDAEGGDDEDMDEDEDDTPEESWNRKSQPQAQEPSISMSPEAYLENLNRAQTNGGAMNTQQVMMVSAPPAPKQDAPKEELVRSNSIEHSTDEDGRITTTYHSGFRPTPPVQTQPQYVDLGYNNRPNKPNLHPSKPWPPKPYLAGGESTDVGTDP